MLPLAGLCIGFAIAGQLLHWLVPSAFVFLTLIGACRDSVIELCQLAMFAVPALCLGCAFVGIARFVRTRSQHTYRAALLGAMGFVVAAGAVPLLAGGAFDPVLRWLPAIGGAVGSAAVLLRIDRSARGQSSD